MIDKTKILKFNDNSEKPFIIDSSNINRFLKKDDQSYLVIPIDKKLEELTKRNISEEGFDIKKLKEAEKILLSSIAKVGMRALVESITENITHGSNHKGKHSLYDEFYDGLEDLKDKNDLKLENMKEFILTDSEWLDSSQLSKKASLKNKNASAGPNNWKSRRKIFAIHHENKNLYPTYCLDAGFHPLKIVKDILEVFGESYSGWYLAYWFGLPNSFLSGDKPKDVLNYTNHGRLIKAASAAKEALKHG
ncbi:hypothetical protein J1786_00300 [Rahnella sp. L72c]|uniref:Uncharacterized protein n=1 Tax=Rahnella perminowiae TaxID=2816244 RepID=A0ABS6KUP9_9GAMM|nr:hypothetical protein [Rahnella perminowiae]MBU9833296.1 hypothetical protein [Rahnella perminowiae]